MRFFSPAEIKTWCNGHGVEVDDEGLPAWPPPSRHYVSFEVPREFKMLTWFCKFVDSVLQPRQECLLCVTRSGVWPSSENWQLYYRLRQSYGDFRLLGEAPGHLFLAHEVSDLVSFTSVAVLSGWDFSIFPAVGYGAAFVSHDEWIEFCFDHASQLEQVVSEATREHLVLRPNKK
jgi:hypothetical protein